MNLIDKLCVGALILLAMVGVWNNWIFIGKDGYNLRWRLRPGFFRFWLWYFPADLLSLPTGMEHLLLQREDCRRHFVFSERYQTYVEIVYK